MHADCAAGFDELDLIVARGAAPDQVHERRVLGVRSQLRRVDLHAAGGRQAYVATLVRGGDADRDRAGGVERVRDDRAGVIGHGLERRPVPPIDHKRKRGRLIDRRRVAGAEREAGRLAPQHLARAAHVGHEWLAERRVHVDLDLAGAQGPVVDSHFVDQAGEELAVDAVATDLQRIARGFDAAGAGRAGDERAVDVQPQRGAVIGQGQVGPGVGAQRRGAEGFDVRAADDHSAGRLAVVRGGFEIVVVVPFVDHVAPGVRHDRGQDPGFQRHAGGEPQRGGVGHIDHGVIAVERQGVAELAGRGPDGVRYDAIVALSRQIGDGVPIPSLNE